MAAILEGVCKNNNSQKKVAFSKLDERSLFVLLSFMPKDLFSKVCFIV